MLRLNRSFLSHKTGIVSIEFAIVFPFLIVLFLFTVEFSRMMFIGSSLDLITTQISRQAALAEEREIDYAEKFNQILTTEESLWPFLASKDNFHVKLEYCHSIKEIIDNRCSSSVSVDRNIMYFTLRYQYFAMFSSIFSRLIDTALTKKVIVYREFK